MKRRFEEVTVAKERSDETGIQMEELCACLACLAQRCSCVEKRTFAT
ncbi:MAG: hypothetical protein IJY15_00200 [Thermoguttaceae bacterium]|nr:hypothetical protein [Thermoguttaceae bacterium]